MPTEAEIRRYYQVVWTAKRTGDIVMIKTPLYTGVRVAELVAMPGRRRPGWCRSLGVRRAGPAQ